MQSFLEETIQDLLGKHEDVSQLTVILPSKRAGGFFKHYLRKQLKRTTFLPSILSIEEFVELLSDLSIVDPSELLLRSYKAYLNTNSIEKKEDFESFNSWIQILLNDFNEIDRYLVDSDQFFSYLGSIKSIEKWSPQSESTDLIKSYLSFWNSLPEFYDILRTDLESDGLGYQGMVYRKAAEEIEHYLGSKGGQPHVFIGFNALNLAEQTVIKELLELGNTSIYWDAEAHFFSGRPHSASQFMKSYFDTWNYYQTNRPELGNNYTKNKKFYFVETQKNIAQAKYAGQILGSMSREELNETAVILCDENLLTPMLYSLPANLEKVNVTMGSTIENSPITIFFTSLLRIQKSSPNKWYFKDVFKLLNNPAGQRLIPNAKSLVRLISEENLTYLSVSELAALNKTVKNENLKIIFGSWKNDPVQAIDNSMELLIRLRALLKDSPLELAIAYELFNILSEIKRQINNFPYLESINSVYTLFQEAAQNLTTDIAGDAFDGLQVMGVLETRVLDFKNLIVLSVNEGVLPAGKSNASFITYDLKKTFNLPLFTDKDAVYAYHFYHLLHRAEQVHFIYNATSEGLNAGEKSRFLMQVETDMLPGHQINYQVVSLPVLMNETPLQRIPKSAVVMDRLEAIAKTGFSPSALTSYIRNPFDFYLSRVLKINEFETVEETVDYHTLGSIVHNSLEKLYDPFVGNYLELKGLKSALDLVDETVRDQFANTYKSGDYSTGKNLLIFEVAKRYVENLIELDLEELESGHRIRILHIEKKMQLALHIDEIPFPVNVQGMVDRVDERDGVIRIIDYKTGMVSQNELQITDWGLLTSDYKYSKAFQVLMYAYMIHAQQNYASSVAGVISFKNFSSGFMQFVSKADAGSSKNHEIFNETLKQFETAMKKLVIEICDPALPFIEKQV